MSKRILKLALNHFGSKGQIIAAVEELSELSVELCKTANGKSFPGNCYPDMFRLVDELADAEIMIEQMKMNFDVIGAVKKRKRTKLVMLENRIKKQKREQGRRQPI